MKPIFIVLAFSVAFLCGCGGGKTPISLGDDKHVQTVNHSNENLGAPILLGEVDVPTGILLLIDPGLGWFWRGDGDPESPRKSDPRHTDFQIVGEDAIAAGKAYDRQFDPRYLFDIPNSHAADFQRRFDEFVANKFKAHLEPLEKRICHTERAFKAIEIGNGLGVVQYNGIWAVAVSGLPKDRSFEVYGTPLLDDEFSGRWRSIDIIVEKNATVAKSETLQGIMVEHGQFICADIKAFNAFRMGESLDGQGDFVFWGADAATLAAELSVPAIDKKTFGWKNLPIKEIDVHADHVQGIVEKRTLKLGTDYRPHCNLERLNAQIRSSPLSAGNLNLSGSKVCGFDNRWGDGIFPVIRDLDAGGRLVRIRIDAGNDDRKKLFRKVMQQR